LAVTLIVALSVVCERWVRRDEIRGPLAPSAVQPPDTVGAAGPVSGLAAETPPLDDERSVATGGDVTGGDATFVEAEGE